VESRHVVKALGALAQETRLAIFRLLVEAGPRGVSVGEIGASVAAAPATLSFHLKELTHAGLIEPRQDGRYIFYRASYVQMSELLAFLTQNCCARGDGACASGARNECASPRPARPAAGRPAKVSRLSRRRAAARQ